MRLVEILARELEEWPEGARCINQDDDRFACSHEEKDANDPEFKDGTWNGKGRVFCERLSELATDHATAIVTREMWEAERERLEDEQDAATVRERQGQPTVPVSLEADWSKAPEGATHRYEGGTIPWRKLEDGAWYAWIDYGWCPTSPANTGCYIPRPTQPQWRGEGLPPVGAEVECEISGSTWAAARVAAHDMDGNCPVAVCRVLGSYYAFSTKCLRPVRTPRDNWIEAALALDCEPCEGMLSRKDFCGKVYDHMIAKLPGDGE